MKIGFVGCALAIIGLVLGTHLFREGAHWEMWVAIYLLFCVAAVPIAIEVQQQRFDWLDLKNVFVLFFVLQFGMWPALVYALDYTHTFALPITFLDSRYESFLKGEWFAIWGQICFYMGRYVPLLQAARRAVLNPTRVGPAHALPLLIVSLLMIALGFLGFVGLTAAGGGFWEYVTHIDQFRTTSLLGVGYLMFLIVSAQVASTALITFYFAYGRYGFVSYCSLIFVLVLGLLGGIRHVVLSAMVGYLVARHFLYKPIRLNLVFVSLAIVFFILNVFYPIYRGLGIEAFEYALNIEYLQDIDWIWAMYTLLGRFHGAETIARVIDITSTDGFQHGGLFVVELLTSMIPRVLWPGKPESSGMVANTTFFYEIFSGGETGAAVITLLGELYWIWGVPVVVIGMYVLGLWFRWLYANVRSQERDVEKIGMYAIAWSFALFVNESLSLHLFHLMFKCIVWFGLFVVVRILAGAVGSGASIAYKRSRAV